MKNEKESEKYYIDDLYIRDKYKGQMYFTNLEEA